MIENSIHSSFASLGASTELYAIGFRKAVGFDALLPASHRDKVAVHRWKGQNQLSAAEVTYRLNELQAGQTQPIMDLWDGTWRDTGLKLTYVEESALSGAAVVLLCASASGEGTNWQNS